MNDLPPHPRSPQRLVEKLLGEPDASFVEPSPTAVARAQAGMRVPLVDLARASQHAAERAAIRVPLWGWLAPAVGAGVGAMVNGSAPLLAVAVAAAVGATVYFIARAMVMMRVPRVAGAVPNAMEVARAFDAVVSAASDLPAAAREQLDAIDSQLAELIRHALLPTDIREVHSAVVRHLPEALGTFRALPPFACIEGEPLLVSQLQSIGDRLTTVMASVQSDRLAASRRLDRFLRNKASR
jgi:hypothetical protein